MRNHCIWNPQPAPVTSLTMTRATLSDLMFTRQAQPLFYHDGFTYCLHRIEREDGTGRRFNLYVTYHDAVGHKHGKWIFVTITD